MTQRMIEFLQDVRDFGVVNSYFIPELRYAVQAEYVTLPLGMIFGESQDCIITTAGLSQIDCARWN